MPLKRGRQALDTVSQTSNASSSSSNSGQLYGSSRLSASSSDYKTHNSPLKRFWNYFSGSARKRPRFDSDTMSDGQLLLTSGVMSSPTASSAAIPLDGASTSTASGFLDLTPSKASSSIYTPLLLPAQEGAIRDPLGRTFPSSSPSIDSAPIIDTRSSSQEAAETQIKHTSPPSSPALPNPNQYVDSAINTDTVKSIGTDTVMASEADQTRDAIDANGAVHDAINTNGTTQETSQPEQALETEPEGQTEPEVQTYEAESNADEKPQAQDVDGEKEAAADALKSSPATEPEGPVEEPVAEDAMSATNSQPIHAGDEDSNDAEHPLPTDDDVDCIQTMANAKVGEHVEGLLDWSGSLGTHDQHPPSASASEASSETDGVSIPHDASRANNHAEVVYLVSDSDDTDSGHDDPDKENDVSLVNVTPRLDSNATLPSIPDQVSFTLPWRVPRARHSFAGPMTQAARRKQNQQESLGSAQPVVSPAQNGFDTANTSATEQIRSIGRQQRFHQPSRRNAPQSSTPQHPQASFSRDRSFSFSSDVSMLSASTASNLSSVHRKRDPIYLKQHKREVSLYNDVTLKRSVALALERINHFRSSKRKHLLNKRQFKELAGYAEKVYKIVAKENPTIQGGHFLDQLQQKLMRQREVDAQTAILPLPRAKMEERERLAREQRARLRKLRGVLGRKELPAKLSEEQDRAASVAFGKRGRIADVTGASVDDKDLQKLRPGQWLNDEVINFYGQLILTRANDADKQRTEAMAAAKTATPYDATTANSSNTAVTKKKGKSKPTRPYDSSLDAFWRVHFFSSFFYNLLKDKGYAGVKRWTRRIDIFSKDLILFPINLGNAHWVCGAINMRHHRFEYYDSLGSYNARAFELMRMYVAEEARDKKGKEIDLRGWKDVFSDESPQQENGFDCGVFAAQTLEQISRRDPHRPIPLEAPVILWKGESLDEGTGRLKINGGTDDDGGEEEEEDDEYEWNFSQENMPYLRRRMAYEIFSKQLLD
ncbi:related to Sentrin-specific protease 1 [Ustilago trichophora]|uniref:Related to Sentrin-specific protease 1 n=1 Tax=Ustilago trichophora TaxID=86804 RepID=A0A5C3DSP1_9BASI|nr:related to Sentrin-specific protease 1 [Ustilago trichophora]